MPQLTSSDIDELAGRIRDDLAYFNGKMPERNAIAWRAYLAALLEWNLMTIADHDQLVRLLPDINDDPVVAILLGRDTEHKP